MLLLVLVGCARAPEATELESAARAVRLGDITLELRLPVGAEVQSEQASSVRFEVPGRGGAAVLLSRASSVGDLAEQTAAAAARSDADGAKPNVVRSETKGGRNFITTVGATGKLVRVIATIPREGGAIQCEANVTRSEPIANVESTRTALETVCESVALR